MDPWAEFGLSGLIVGACVAMAFWSLRRVIGKDGIMESHAKGLQAVATCVDRHLAQDDSHHTACEDSNEKVTRLHKAGVALIGEIEAECKIHGLDVSERCHRIREILEVH